MIDAQDREFDVVAAWTADELTDRDQMSRFAGASRGSGSPSALAWLAESLVFAPGVRLLDVGAGLGGPAAWATERYGVWPVAVEPMLDADLGSSKLFGHPVVAATASALPLRSASFDVAWMLGVLDTIEHPVHVLAEVRRALGRDGRLGLLAYVASGPIQPEEAPPGNHFQPEADLLTDLRSAGFEVVDRAEPASLPDAPLDWRVRQDRLERRLRDRHGRDPRWQEAEAQEQALARLLDRDRVGGLLLHAVCA